MSDPSPSPKLGPDAGNEARLRPDRQSLPGLPRWVKVAAFVAIVLVVVFVAVHLAGGGMRGHAPLSQFWVPLP